MLWRRSPVWCSVAPARAAGARHSAVVPRAQPRCCSLLPSVVPCGEHGAVLLPPWRRAAAPLVWRCHSPGVCALFSSTAPFRDDCTTLLLPGVAHCGGRARRRAVTPRCGILQRPCVGVRCSAVVPRAHATGASYCAWVLSCKTVASYRACGPMLPVLV